MLLTIRTYDWEGGYCMHVSGLSMLLTIRTYDWEGGYCMHVSTTVYAADNTYIRLGRWVLYAR